MKLGLMLMVISLCGVVAQAADARALVLQHYPGARIVFETQGEIEDYTLALGSYKKISGLWQVDNKVRLSGQQERYTVEFPPGYAGVDGFEFYLDQLQNYSVRELFHCVARDCGTSNSWANNHFKILQLYGLDQYQQYGAYEVTDADAAPFYVALYTVRRGNKRVVAQIDVVHVKQLSEPGVASSAESLIKALDTNGYYVFPDTVLNDASGNSKIQIKSAHSRALVQVLGVKSTWKLALVGHEYTPMSLSVQQKKSQAYADQLKAALVSEGVDEKRLSTYGMGSLAPAGKGDRSARVEVVKLIE